MLIFLAMIIRLSLYEQKTIIEMAFGLRRPNLTENLPGIFLLAASISAKVDVRMKVSR